MARPILIAAGGTGGHLFPGLAVADELARRDGSRRVVFAGTPRGLESRLVPRAGYPLEVLPILPLNAVGFLRMLQGLLALPRGLLRAAALVRRLRPEAVLGVGGYAGGPVVLVAALLGVRSVILEPNAKPGFTNRVHRPQDAVREAGLRVRLQDHRAHSQEGGHEHDRAPRVAAHPEDRFRTQAPDEGGRAQKPPGQREEALEHPEEAHRVEGQDGQQLERVAGAGDEARLEPPRRPREDDAAAPPAAMRIGRAIQSACWETLSTRPTPKRAKTSEDPPALMKGRGIPLVGTRPRTTLMLMKAWITMDRVRPAARNIPKASGAFQAARRPRQSRRTKASSTRSAPSRPSSSPITAKMKSLYG